MNRLDRKQAFYFPTVLDALTNPDHPDYDAAFDAAIRRLRPHWFERCIGASERDREAYELLDNAYTMTYQDYSKLVRRGGSDENIAEAVADLDRMAIELKVAKEKWLQSVVRDLDTAVTFGDLAAISEFRDQLIEATKIDDSISDIEFQRQLAAFE